MEHTQARKAAAELLHIAAAYDGREYDDFTVTAWASGVSRHHELERQDWHQGLENHYLRPGATRIRIGDLIAEAKAAKRTRTGSGLVAIDRKVKIPKPANFDHMVATAAQITREFRAEGIPPTQDEVERELARRLRQETQHG